ncbi:MAG: hypothetical protein OEM82_13870 [Acidobacteriota bacterium]|nr:hypothetical protein [Acidobacteriota bacterium]MDH3528587.1 hypothetical protein [Acidobacteriota bacterium]
MSVNSRNKARQTTTFLLLLGILAFTAVKGTGQDTPLTLSEVLTALQSTSSGLNLADKNTFITQRVEERGVTFELSEVIASELRNAGATPSLIAAIRRNGPQSNQSTTTASANETKEIRFEKLWVEMNVEKSGRQGMIIHTNFSAYNLRETPLQLRIRFRDGNGSILTTTNESFANDQGELAQYKNFKPVHNAALYDDWSVFVPYDEMNLNPGTHNLLIEADIVDAQGEFFAPMTTQEVVVVKARPSLRAPRAVFERMWVDYGVTEGGLLGMRIHVKLKTYNLKDTTCYLRIGFEKENGEKLLAGNTIFSDRKGGLTLLSALTPASATANYNDVSVFVPYAELKLPKGKHLLRLHGDLVYQDGGLIKHLNYYRFAFTV